MCYLYLKTRIKEARTINLDEILVNSNAILQQLISYAKDAIDNTTHIISKKEVEVCKLKTEDNKQVADLECNMLDIDINYIVINLLKNGICPSIYYPNALFEQVGSVFLCTFTMYVDRTMAELKLHDEALMKNLEDGSVLYRMGMHE